MKNIFISHSYKDSEWLKEIYKIWKPALYYDSVDFWSDNDIDLDETWRDALARSLLIADVIVVLISPHYANSVNLKGEELQSIIQTSKQTPLYPILLTETSLDDDNLNKLNFVNTRPLSLLSQTELEKELMKILEKIAENLKVKINQNRSISIVGNVSSSNINTGDNIFQRIERRIMGNK